MEAVDVLIGLLLGIIVIEVLRAILGEIGRRKDIILTDPTKEVTKQLYCPSCGSTDYTFEEVTTLPWIKGEDRYCRCNKCGMQFGDGK